MPAVTLRTGRVVSGMFTPAERSRCAELRAFYAMVQRREHEHAEALALLNRLSPNPPQWARDAVAAAWRLVVVARNVERRASSARKVALALKSPAPPAEKGSAMMNHEELRRVLRRMPRDRFVSQALAMLDDGNTPDAELLRRCGIRTVGAEVVA